MPPADARRKLPLLPLPKFSGNSFRVLPLDRPISRFEFKTRILAGDVLGPLVIPEGKALRLTSVQGIADAMVIDAVAITVTETIGGFVKRTALCLAITLLAASPYLLAQNSDQTAPPLSEAAKDAPPAPFSRLALSGGIGTMGINMQAAVNANRYFNIRGIGNYFSYTVSNLTINKSGGSNGITVGGNFKFATAGASLDIYPFPNHGFRLSPGVILYNQNSATATGIAAPGTSFTFGSQKYYSDTVNPLNITAKLGLNARQRAFSMTTGWGNLIPRNGGHWSFPFEIGAVFTGSPTLALNPTGNACLTAADAAINGPSCVNMATDSTAQANVAAQVAKYQKDLNVVPVYPIISFGIGYNFRLR